MKYILLVGFFSCIVTFSAQNDTMLKYFRVTNINKNKIALAGNIDSLKSILIKDGNNNYHLKKGSFTNSDSIGIEVNNEGKIVSITFQYDYAPEFSNDTAYIHELRKYQKIIGKGSEFKHSGKNKSVTVTKWEDQKTIFELVQVIINGKKQKVYSTLYDIQLVEANSEIKMERKKKGQPITIIREL